MLMLNLQGCFPLFHTEYNYCTLFFLIKVFLPLYPQLPAIMTERRILGGPLASCSVP